MTPVNPISTTLANEAADQATEDRAASLGRRIACIVGSTAMAAALCITPVALSGCNTVEGAGEDISAGGDAIDRAAERAN